MAKFRKFRGTRDSGWLFGRGGNCGAVGCVSTLLCSSVVCIFVVLLFLCYILLFVRLKEFCL